MDRALDAFGQFEHDSWERVAGAYTAAYAALTPQFAEPLLGAVGVAAKARLLDVACGPGHVASTATQLGASVVGLDFSAAMLRIARARHRGIEFVEGDAQRLPFPDASFDRVVMNFGVLHLSDPDRAFADARRVLRRGGRYGFTVWAKPELNRGMGIVTEAVERHGVPPHGIPEGPDRLRLADEAECRRALGAAGFERASVTFATHEVRWTVPTAGFLFDAQHQAAVRTAAVLRQQPPERLERIRTAVQREVERYPAPGGYAVPMAAHIVTATAPDKWLIADG